MLWVKAFHIIFAVSWYAGLLYLPRLFVYHATTTDTAGNERFKVMERKLFGIMSIGGAGTIVFGVWLLVAGRWTVWDSGGATPWLIAKLALVAGLIAFHFYCAKVIADFRVGRNRHSERFFRLFNELPALALVAIVVFVVVKPFQGG